MSLKKPRKTVSEMIVKLKDAGLPEKEATEVALDKARKARPCKGKPNTIYKK